MRRFTNRLSLLLVLVVSLVSPSFITVISAHGQPSAPAVERGVPILLYHRFADRVNDGMTVTTGVLEGQLRYLRDNGYRVIPLRQLVEYLLNRGPEPPPRSVVIVADDAHMSVYGEMLPLVRRYRVPVTLFVYPSAISNANYAMTWGQLRELKQTGLFDIQSHTYWHPNFKREKRHLSPDQYARLVDTQLRRSRERLTRELGGPVDLLAWPFGIHDQYLEDRAAAAGYRAAFTIERRHCGAGDKPMRLPRYLLVNGDSGPAFARILAGSAPPRKLLY